MMLIIELEILTSLSHKCKLPQFQNSHPFGLFTLSFFLHKYFFPPLLRSILINVYFFLLPYSLSMSSVIMKISEAVIGLDYQPPSHCVCYLPSYLRTGVPEMISLHYKILGKPKFWFQSWLHHLACVTVHKAPCFSSSVHKMWGRVQERKPGKQTTFFSFPCISYSASNSIQ